MIGTVRRWAGRVNPARRRAVPADAGPADEGFVLLESMIAITLITLVMAALGTFFVNGLASTNYQRSRQVATQVATTAVESLRSMPADALVAGRDASSVQTQFDTAAAKPKIKDWVTATAMTREADPSVTSGGATAAVPTVPVAVKVDKIDYQVSKFVGKCATLGGNDTNCTAANVTPPAGTKTVPYYRIVVAVEWSNSSCPDGTCTYVTATLVTATGDPTFNRNQAPANPPVVDAIPNQTSVVGDVIDLQLQPRDGTGVPTFTWSTTSALPAGITLLSTGQFTGTATTATATPLSITVTVTDAFLRKATSAAFTWTVAGPVTATPPTPQSSIVGTSITALTITASGGSGAPYTWSDPSATLPPGLSVAASSTTQGRITGTPTKAGTYDVDLQIADAGGHKGSVKWTWTVGFGPLVAASPGAQKSTVGVPAVRQLTATGGSGNYSWTANGTLPFGFTITTAGRLSGTPSTTGSDTVNVTLTDSVTKQSLPVSIPWTVLARPTVVTPSNQKTTVGAPVNLSITSSCPNAPCTYTLLASPPNITFNLTNTAITGTVGGSAGSYPSATISIVDADGATVTSGTFTWTVAAPLRLGTPATQTVARNTPDSLDMATYLAGGTGPYAYSDGGTLPNWLDLDPVTGKITGTSPPSRSVTSNVKITVTDAAGATVTTAAFKWVVTDLKLAVPDQWVTPSSSSPGWIYLPDYLSGGSGSGYTYTVSGVSGSWLSVSGNYVGTSATRAPSSRSVTSISVTVTDSDGASVTSTFRWYVASLEWTLSDQQVATSYAYSVDLDGYLTGSGSASAIQYTGPALPAGWTYDSGTHVLKGTTPATPTVLSGFTFGVTESSGFVFDTAPFSLTVTNLRWSGVPTTKSTKQNTATTLDMATYDSGGKSPYMYEATGLPTGLTIDAATGLISGSPPSRGTWYVNVTVTDVLGATTTTGTITWTVTR